MLPTIWVDTANILVREDPAVAMIRFYTTTPEALIEACRIQTPSSHLRNLIKTMAKALDYYPSKDEPAM